MLELVDVLVDVVLVDVVLVELVLLDVLLDVELLVLVLLDVLVDVVWLVLLLVDVLVDVVLELVLLEVLLLDNVLVVEVVLVVVVRMVDVVVGGAAGLSSYAPLSQRVLPFESPSRTRGNRSALVGRERRAAQASRRSPGCREKIACVMSVHRCPAAG